MARVFNTAGWEAALLCGRQLLSSNGKQIRVELVELLLCTSLRSLASLTAPDLQVNAAAGGATREETRQILQVGNYALAAMN